MKKRTENRGAALVEYVMLLGLIGVVALSSVSLLGTKVVGVFDVTSDNLASVQYSADGGDAWDNGELEDLDAIRTPTLSWKNGGTDTLPSYVQEDGSGWIIDLEPVLRDIVDTDDPDQMGRLRFNAQLYERATLEPKAEGLNSVSLKIDPRVRWLYPNGYTKYLINKAVFAEDPEREAVAIAEVSNRDVPEGATGIKIARFFSCAPNARCERDAFSLNVEFFLAPE